MRQLLLAVLFVVWCLVVACEIPFGVWCFLCAIRCVLFSERSASVVARRVVRCLLYADCYLVWVVCLVLRVVRWLVFVVCCVMRVVCCVVCAV